MPAEKKKKGCDYAGKNWGRNAGDAGAFWEKRTLSPCDFEKKRGEII